MTGRAKTTLSGATVAQRQPLRLVDVIVGVVTSVLSLLIFAVILFGLVPYAPAAVGVTVALITVVVWVAAEALFIRTAARRRISFYWPLVGSAVMVAAVNIIFVIASGKA